jgi:hypothetical protein
LPERTAGWPRTVEEAVSELLVALSEEDKVEIRDRSKEALLDLHFALGLDIRNRFGLNSGNVELMGACARHLRPDDPVPDFAFHQDDASSVIVEALWTELSRRG